MDMDDQQIADALQLAQEIHNGNGFGNDAALDVADLALHLNEQLRIARAALVTVRAACANVTADACHHTDTEVSIAAKIDACFV